MDDFTTAKSQLRNKVWHGVFDTGGLFEAVLDAIEAAETPEQLARVEDRIRQIAAARPPTPEAQAFTPAERTDLGLS